MDPIITSSLISSGSSLIGGLLGNQKGSSRALGQQESQFNAMRMDERQRWLENIQLQKEFAKNGIRWKAEDAERAGFHPLYAISGGQAFTPQPYSMSASGVPSYDKGGTDIGSTLSNIGQDIGSAIYRQSQKADRHTDRMRVLAEERGELENAVLSAQLAKLTAAPAPPLPHAGAVSSMPGQGNFEVVAPERVAVDPTRPSQEAGVDPYTKWVRTSSGGYKPLPGSAVGEGDITEPATAEWFFQNRLMPFVGRNLSPPPDKYLPKDAIGWRWNTWRDEYEPMYRKGWTDYIWGTERRK